MNVSLNGIFVNYYHFIKGRLSSLTPLQKKVALVALASFTCASIGYLIYRYYCFQAHHISGKKAEEGKGEDLVSPLNSKLNKEKPSPVAENIEAAPKPDFDDSLQEKNQEIKQHSPQKQDELHHADAEQIHAKISEAADDALQAENKKEENKTEKNEENLEEISKRVEEVSKQQFNFETTHEPIIEETHTIKKSLDMQADLDLDFNQVQELPDSSDLDQDLKELNNQSNYDLEADLGNDSLNENLEKDVGDNLGDDIEDGLDDDVEPEEYDEINDVALQKLLESLDKFDPAKFDELTDDEATEISQIHPVEDERQKEIEERLEKNCNFARKQQENEKAKGFRNQLSDIPKNFRGKPLVNKEKVLNGWQIGDASCEGMRSAMEDESLVAEISFSTGDQLQQAQVFAIFDGHGGAAAAKYTKYNLASYLKEAFEEHNQDGLTDVGIWDALKDCFKKLDADYEGADGTTATVAICLGDRILVANVGDSRTILVKKGGEAVQASEDAKPDIARYKKKIEKLGGSVLFTRGTHRVNGHVAVARAIGDKWIQGSDKQCCISPNPKITCYSLEDFEAGHLVLACDGLYDVATTNEVAQAILQMAGEGIPAHEMALYLVHSALLRGTSDNVSVMVVAL